MLKFNIINVQKNIDRNLSTFLKHNPDTEKALIEGIANLKNMKTESALSFDSLTYLAVNYFYDHIYVFYNEDNGIRNKHYYKKKESTTIADIKALLDVCNYTPYTPIEKIKNKEFTKLFRAKLFEECYLIIQTAYFFGSKRFGNHPYFEAVEHYRITGEILQNGVEEERLKSAIKKIDDYKKWMNNPAEFKKRPIPFNKENYLNIWYYGVLDILANTFGTCKNYKYEYKIKDGGISEYRLYNKFILTPRILRKIQPFEIVEFDIKSGHLSYIDLFLGSRVAKTAYENYAKKYNVTRDVAKRKFQTILNLRDYRNTWKAKQKYIDTLCDFGWTLEQAKIILEKITDSPDYLFGHWATNYERKYVEKFAFVNNIYGWTRGHDSLTILKRNDIDYTTFINSFENGVIQFELTEIVLQKGHLIQLEKGKHTDIIDPFSLGSILKEIKEEIEKFQRIEGEVLNGFLSDRIEELNKFYSCRHINILISPASSGKTSMVEKLKEKNNRCLLIVPTKAIIKNKNLIDFVQVLDTIDIQKYIKTTDSIICTFDKGAQIKVEDFGKFDYVFIDESHLLFTERYRMNAIVLLLKKIKKFILSERSNQDPLRKSTITVLMTGTPTGEEIYFETDEVGKSLVQKKEFINHKSRIITFVGCENRDACYTSFINNTKDLLADNSRVLIATNMGEKWINCVAGSLGYPNFAIYSNNQKYNKLSEDINKFSMVNNDIELIFTTSLGNVGIDINNTDRETILAIYTDNQNSFTWQEIEQYANRFRKINVKIVVFFIVPQKIEYQKDFVFNYVEDVKTISLIKNDIATDLFKDTDFENMEDDYGVDKDKVRWKVLNEKLKVHHSNIICIGGNLKAYGYNVEVKEGSTADSFLLKEYHELLKYQNELEKQSKERALDFILSDPLTLIRNLNDYKINSGVYIISKEEKILTLENEQIYREVRSIVKRCLGISGYIVDYSWIKKLMEECNMNFKEIDNRIKFMNFVNNDIVDDLDNRLIDEVDKIVNMIDGSGSLTKCQYKKMFEDLCPKYSNKAYGSMDHKTKLKLQENFKKKLDVCYIIKQGNKVEFKQRYTQSWKSEVIDWFENNVMCKLGNEVQFNKRLLRNRKGMAVGLNIGKAYEHITDDMIIDIDKKLEFDGFITVNSIMEITGLSNKSVGGFVKAKFNKLRSINKMIKGVRETRYVQ